MAIAAAPSLSSLESVWSSTSSGITGSHTVHQSRLVPRLAGARIPFSGATHFHWLPVAHDLFPSKVLVASDFSGAVPDSSSDMGNSGYHPLEDLKNCKRSRDTKLTDEEVARTTVEANTSALLVFPGGVHCEPHENSSWAHYQYAIDDYGDIFVEIFDDENILQDPGANSPMVAFIGMDVAMHENIRTYGDDNISRSVSGYNIPLDDEYIVDDGSEIINSSIEWVTSEDSSLVHPIYFSKCLTKALNMQYRKLLDHPSNGVSIVGCLTPLFIDEEPYLRVLFHSDAHDTYSLDPRDGESLSFSSKSGRKNSSSILYRLDIMQIELFSVYGIQSEVSVQDFQNAEPDALVHSASAIIEQFKNNGVSCGVARKTLCKRKGLHVEGANLIGVDSLGIDVRVFSGVEVQTHRFPFKVRADSEATAEKEIRQLLFPRSRRKRLSRRGLED